MATSIGPSAGTGLEHSCGRGEWIRGRSPFAGVELLEAYFRERAYTRHRHDTYTICVTERGVQTFDYRGRTEASLPGQVTVLHPDEPHDGRPGSDDGFGYRSLYVEPALIAEALRAVGGRPLALPFVRQAVSHNPTLARAVTAAFCWPAEPLALDTLLLQLAEGLLQGDPAGRAAGVPLRLDDGALTRARAFLRHRCAVVSSAELEALTGMSRYGLARQFRARYGTSPYRYSVMRRLDAARWLLRGGTPLVEVALATGFADQAHFTRAFRAAYGITPGRFAWLQASDRCGAPGRS